MLSTYAGVIFEVGLGEESGVGLSLFWLNLSGSNALLLGVLLWQSPSLIPRCLRRGEVHFA